MTRPIWRGNPRFAEIPPYAPGVPSPTEPGSLASNEFALGASPLVHAAVERAARRIHRYPDPLATAVCQRVANELDVAVDQVLIGNGSDELIYLLMMTFGGDPLTVVVADPPYQLHANVPKIFGAEVVTVPLVDWRHDLAGMSEVDADVAIICNPHNPTGRAVDRGAIAEFAERSSARLIVIDEAYIEFAENSDSLTSLPLARSGDVVLMRSFSKSLALAGARIGFVVAPAELVSLLRKIRPPFSVNSLGQAAALAALEESGHRAFIIDEVQMMRSRLREFFESLGYVSVPSEANFVLVLTPDEGGFCSALTAFGVSVRPGSQLGVPGSARVTVPSREGFALIEKARPALEALGA